MQLSSATSFPAQFLPPKKQELATKQASVSLSAISGPVLEIVKSKGPLSFPEVADEFIASQGLDGLSKEKQEKSVKRRIYDVLNVLLACNLVMKDEQKKVSIYTPNANQTTPDLVPKEEVKKLHKNRVQEKTKILIGKTRLLIYYQLLIARNQSMLRPAGNVQMPVIVVGYPSQDGTIRRSFDGHELTISSSISPLFFSPENIFKKLKFDQKIQITYLRSMNIFGPLEREILDQITNEEEQQSLE